VPLPGPGRLLAVKPGVKGLKNGVSLCGILPSRDRQGVPLDPSQILRGTTGNTGELPERPPEAGTAPPQVSPGTSP
jgi:hypothetical protein